MWLGATEGGLVAVFYAASQGWVGHGLAPFNPLTHVEGAHYLVALRSVSGGGLGIDSQSEALLLVLVLVDPKVC